MKTGVNAIDSDDEEENAKQEKKMKYKKLDMKKVNGVEDDPECGQMDEEGNMITGHGGRNFCFCRIASKRVAQGSNFEFEGSIQSGKVSDLSHSRNSQKSSHMDRQGWATTLKLFLFVDIFKTTTPQIGFNLKDEMEEGEFDSTGQFHFKRTKREDQDEWLDSLDWKAIK